MKRESFNLKVGPEKNIYSISYCIEGGCLKRTVDTVYQLKRKVAVTNGGFSFSGSIQEVIKFRE